MKEGVLGAQGFKNLLVFASSTTIIAVSLFFSVNGASAQGRAATSGSSHESERAAQVRGLNNSVLQLHGQMQENAAGAAGVRGQAAIVLAQRAAALQALIQQDPHTALTFAFSPELLADLAEKFPDSAAQLEQHATISGPIEHWTFDSADGKTSKSLYKMRVAQQTVNLYFASHEPDLTNSDVFQVSGVVAGQTMAVETTVSVASSTALIPIAPPISAVLLTGVDSLRKQRWPVVALLSLFILGLLSRALRLRRFCGQLRQFAACAVAVMIFVFSPSTTFGQSSCSTTGVQNTAVILVTFAGVTLPTGVTAQSLNDAFFGTSTGVSLDGFLRAASYGQTSATGSVFGPYTLTGTYGACTDLSGAVLNDAIAAALAGGANLSNYSRVFLVFPDTLNCGWAGFASNACGISSSSGNFNASVAYLAARYAALRANTVSLASHEIGHNFGLLHSGIITAAGADVLGSVSSPGTMYDQNGDYWSSMGEIVLGTYPSPQKAEVLGWLAPISNYATIQSGGTYTLQPLETSPAGLQALKVQRGTGNNAWLWIEYRQPVNNYDSTLSAQPFSGALIHYEDANTQTGHTYLPNFTPSDTTWNSPALAVGQTWTDPYSNVSISVQSATSTGLTVSVSYGATPCTASTPSVNVSPLNPSIYPGQTANYSVSVTNNDSTGCSSSTINLTSSEPSGWSTNFSVPAVTLSPGQSASVTLGKGVPSGTPTGTYAVTMTASNTSANATGAANATVVTPQSLAVSLSVSGTSFTRPSTVPITVSVNSGGAPTSGASVMFTLTTPSGSAVTQSATTNSNGTASWSYKVNQKSPAGTYSVTAQAALSSGSRKTASTQSVSSNTATFSVQ